MQSSRTENYSVYKQTFENVEFSLIIVQLYGEEDMKIKEI